MMRARTLSGRGRGGSAMAALLTGLAALGMGTALRFDFFLVDILVLAIVYVPLERLFPRVAQPIMRDAFATDVAYFFVNHVLVQVTVFLAVAPATILLAWARYAPLVRAVEAQPLALQIVEIVALADLFQYAAHRLFHAVPFLWRLHAVHHSSKRLDWLAGSRLHLVDAIIVRASTFAPLFVFGFSHAAIRIYAAIVALLGVFLHANLRLRLGFLEKVVTTPRYHAFHHAADVEAFDKNFAFHLPILDRLFGTQYLPERPWPERYGITDAPTVPFIATRRGSTPSRT